MFFVSSDAELMRRWKYKFTQNIETQLVKLKCMETMSFELLVLSFESSRLTWYARDILHFALVAEMKQKRFWSNLLENTYEMETLCAIDQADMITTCLLLLEKMNWNDVHLPKTCFELENVELEDNYVTEATQTVLANASFVAFDVALDEML